MNVLRPSKNKLTGNYSASHKGYDFSGKGESLVYASFDGVVVASKNSETKNWQASTFPLTTADYGNYCKIKGKLFQLVAHLEPNSALAVGVQVKTGMVLGVIGNTGNSTAKHLHCEYRFLNNVNTPVEFTEILDSQPPIDNNEEVITSQTKIPQIENKEVQAIASELADLRRDNTSLSKALTSIQAELQKAKETPTAMAKTIKEVEEIVEKVVEVPKVPSDQELAFTRLLTTLQAILKKVLEWFK